MKTKNFIINTSFTELYSKPNSKKDLETECIYGQSFYLSDISNNWVYGTINSDNYRGWIKKKYLSDLFYNSHKIVTILSIVKLKPNIRSKTLGLLPYGARIKVTEHERDWAKFIFLHNGIKQDAYIPEKHIATLKYKIEDYTSITEKFIGTPYKWGGKTALGIDCSGLLQICLQDHKRNIPRNSKDQEIIFNGKDCDKANLKRGDLVFWEGHVGIMQNEKYLIHANSFHMRVISEKLDDVIDRIRTNYKLEPRMYKL
tara:strand:- start:746 stop:1516 length:771 start_codon:yes stop_codon:yes gene_type:complete